MKELIMMKIYKLKFRLTKHYFQPQYQLRDMLPKEVWSIEPVDEDIYMLSVICDDWKKYKDIYQEVYFDKVGDIYRAVEEIELTALVLKEQLEKVMSEMIEYGLKDRKEANVYIKYYVDKTIELLKEIQ